MEIALLLGATELGYDAPREADVRASIARLSALEWAPYVGRISSALHLQLHREDLQRDLAERLLSPPVRRRLYARAREELASGKRPLWVSPAQLRVVLKLLFEGGAREGGMGRGQDGAYLRLGSAILSVQPTFREAVDLGPEPRGPRASLHAFLQFRHAATVPSARPYATLAHKEAVYERIFSQGDLRARFAQWYGADPLDVHRGLAALWAAFSILDADLLRASAENCVDHRMLFGRFGVSQAAGRLILEQLARDLREIGEMPPPAPGVPWSSDLGFLVSKPLGMIDDVHVCCLDFEFLRSAYARLLFNLTTRMLGRDEANRLVHQEGGHLLEEGLGRAFDGFRSERPEPRSTVWFRHELVEDELEVDGAVAEGNEVALFEFKAGMLPPSLTYGTSVAALAEEIDKRFVKVDQRGDPKGFTQLAATARRLLDEPSLLGLKRIKRIYPVLVVEDDDLPFKPLVLYALDEAKRILGPLGGRVAAPLLLHAEDVALLAERCRRYPVPYMLKRLGREAFVGMAYRDVVLERLPVDDDERVGVSRAFPLTDAILDEIEAQVADDATASLCAVCGRPERIYTSLSGRLVSGCLRCPEASAREVSNEVLDADLESRRRWVAAYV